MFYYVSFLRPPPTQVLLGAGTTITPQIANDLRTELYPETQDICYSWSPCLSPTTSSSYPMQITKPVKLTTWRVANAYREVTVPPPQGAKDGQAYRLVLTVHAQGCPHIVKFGCTAIGDRPFPVISMPITFCRCKVSAAKQEQVERVYCISVKPTEQAFLAIKEKTSFDLDKKIWDSGVGLSAWLVELATQEEGSIQSQAVRELRSLLFSRGSCNIIELGAGTGVVSLTLGALRSLVPLGGDQSQGRIITTDLGSAMPLLEKNIVENATLFRYSSVRPQAVVLDWDETVLHDEVQNSYDLIIMADVTYNTASFPSLVRTVRNLLCLNESKLSMVLLGYKERDTAERSLWPKLRDIGIRLEKIGERGGAGANSVEVWMARTHSDVPKTTGTGS